jgi:hypothetical protein
MDSQLQPFVIAAVGLAAGACLCWLVLRVRIADAASTAAHGKAEAQNELASTKERIRLFEEDRRSALRNCDELKAQADQAHKGCATLSERASRVPQLESQLTELEDRQRNSQGEVLKLSKSEAEKAQSLQSVSEQLAKEEQSNAALNYDAARGKLSVGRGNVIRQAEMLRGLGIKPSKKLSPALVGLAVDGTAMLSAELDEDPDRP